MDTAKATTTDEYLAGLPEEQGAALQKLRELIRASVPPDATETMAWGMPNFNYKGHVVSFAAFKKHLSLFPMSGTILDDLKDELRGFATTKGTIHFTPEKPLPDALVKKIVTARVKENEAREAARSAGRGRGGRG